MQTTVIIIMKFSISSSPEGFQSPKKVVSVWQRIFILQGLDSFDWFNQQFNCLSSGQSLKLLEASVGLVIVLFTVAVNNLFQSSLLLFHCLL